MLSFKDIGVTTLTFLGSRDVIAHVIIGLAIFCRWSVWTDRLSRTVVEILNFKYIESRPWPFGVKSSDVIAYVTVGLLMRGFLLVVNMNRPCISNGCWDTELQGFWCHDLDLLGSRDVISHVTLNSWYVVSYRWSFETIALTRIVVEILCVKHLAKHIRFENALIPIFVF